MEFRLDKSLYDLGIKNVVIGIAKNVDPHADLPLAFLKKKEEREKWALECDVKEVQESPVIQGYRQLLQRVGRSVRKIHRRWSPSFAISSIVAPFLTSIVSSISTM